MRISMLNKAQPTPLAEKPESKSTPREAQSATRGGPSGRNPRGVKAGRGAGRGGGRECNLCKQPGHVSKQCPWPDGRCPDAICSFCGRQGHVARACDFGDEPDQVRIITSYYSV